MSERMFPVIYSREGISRGVKPGPQRIPWSVAELAYAVYAARSGQGQTMERMAERGGFYVGELDELLPDWRERSSEVTELRATIAALTAERDAAIARAEAVEKDAGRIDWLDRNCYNKEMGEWDRNRHSASCMWVFFAPDDAQGSVRRIIDAAIAKHANANLPGKWSVNSGEGYIMLVWTCDEDESPEMQNGAEPWEQCGGDAILETADIGDFHDSGGDAYQDKFGENVITQWVQWNISDEDE